MWITCIYCYIYLYIIVYIDSCWNSFSSVRLIFVSIYFISFISLFIPLFVGLLFIICFCYCFLCFFFFCGLFVVFSWFYILLMVKFPLTHVVWQLFHNKLSFIFHVFCDRTTCLHVHMSTWWMNATYPILYHTMLYHIAPYHVYIVCRIAYPIVYRIVYPILEEWVEPSE